MSERSSPWLKSRAKAMRAEMTPQEKIIWRLLHDGELIALNWRRQAAFGKYLLDFVSHAADLVVEIDGAQHGEKAQVAHDAQRSVWLKSQGYRVLRVWNAEALKERDGVWRTIHAAASETPALVRMQRWREAIGTSHLPLDGGGGERMRAGGGVRASGEGEVSGDFTGNLSGPHPLSHAARDSSPIEGERE
jgi:very-short-patch-repair endonuclease